MNSSLSDVIKFYGTDEPVNPMRELSAGPFTCVFDQGALRYIKVYGKEAIRNIAFVVRDKDWGTLQPELSNLQISQTATGFTVSYDALCGDQEQQIHYTATISASADGILSFVGKYTCPTDFLTNRTGFVVLHPLVGVAGESVQVEKVDGAVVASCFPELIDPGQPFKDIRALTHEVLPGVSVCCRMTGDTFEMEDHRQWNDASYKTYVRPLALPWPYCLSAGDDGEQAVTLTIGNDAGRSLPHVSSSQERFCTLSVNPLLTGAQMPRIGLGLEPQHLDIAPQQIDLLANLQVQQLVIWHEWDKHTVDDLRKAAELGRVTGVSLVLHAVIPDRHFQQEIHALCSQCRDAGLQLSAISVTPAMYLRSITPGSSWPDVTPLAELYDEVRRHFPNTPVGGGMLAFFPELNRHRPPVEHLDFITHASNTITHACDDISVNENLEALPYILQTCREFGGGKPYHVGPSSIAMRFNPYGSKTMDNPNNKRIAMARMDPRQRGLLNVAWTVGYMAHMVRGAVDCVNLHAPTGEFGVIYQSQSWPQPGFDNTQRIVYPAYHAVAGFALASGHTSIKTSSSVSRDVELVAYECAGKTTLWIANLSADPYTVNLQGLDASHGEVAELSADTFHLCTKQVNGFELTSEKTALTGVKLGPYTTLRVIAD